MPVTTRSQTKKLTSSNEEPKIYVSESLKIMTQLLQQIDNEKDFDKRMILIQNAYKYIYQNITIVLQKERIGDWIIFLDMCIDKIKKLSDQLDIVEFWLQEIDTFYLSKEPEKNEFIRSKVHALINTINKLVVLEWVSSQL